MNPLTQAVISGLMMGAVYAMLSVGLVIVYQTAHVINLAHGEAYAIAGIFVSVVAGTHMLPIWAAIVGAIIVAVLVSICVERFLLRPRRSWSHSALILITLAAAIFSRGVLYTLVGSDAVSFPRLISGAPFRIAGGMLPPQGLLLIVIAFVLAIAVPVFLSVTPLGRQLRATAENPDAAQLMGINVDQARTLAFAIAGAYGAAGAVLLVPLVSVDFHAGLDMTLRGFIAAALGGMLPFWAVVCSVLLGLGEALVTSYFDALAKDPIVFLVLICVAVWRSRKIRFGGGLRA
jgi:branched-subunit amino acid ABC-type transport system permease component